MRVALNGQFLLEPHTGTGRYVFNLIAALGRVDGINDYLVMTSQRPDAYPETPSSFEWQVAPIRDIVRGSRRTAKLYWEQRAFPQAAKREGAHVIHVPHFAPPLRPSGLPVVVTIHDVINLREPEYRASASAHAYARLVAHAARSATMVITVSHYTKQEISEALQIPDERIVVIPEAPAPHYRRVTDPEQLNAVRSKYGLGERYVLNVGGLDARKNVRGLIGAFAAAYHELGDRELTLFIAGDQQRLGTGSVYPDWRPLVATFGIADQVRCAPVDEDDLAALYSGAACFVFTSLYEGFGLTPLEAMACGAPVVCSDRTSLPEVVGSAGVLVDPTDADQVGGAIVRVLSDTAYARDLSERGLAHVKLFSWDRTAVQTAAVYAAVGEQQES